MRKTSSFFYLCMLACACLFLSCQDEEKSPARPGDVRFTIRSRPLDAPDGRTPSVLPRGGKLYVTVLKANGDVVFDLKEIPFAVVGDYVVSEPFPLAPGDYNVTQFIISSEDDGTYAAPLEGSSVAEWVDDPLPIPFTVSHDNLTDVAVQVLPFNDEVFTPEDFGYVSFGVSVAPYPYFKLAVFKPGPEGPVPAAVQAYLLDGADTLVNKALSSGTHPIAFVGDRSGAYTLVLKDDTYGIYAQSFVLDSLLDSLHGEPWAVTLKPAVTIVSDDDAGWNFVGMHLEGWHGEVSVDWGDGTRSTYGGSMGYSSDAPHEYAMIKPRVVSITGDLNDVTTLHIYNWAGIRQLQLEHVPSLLNLGVTTVRSTPTTLDLRNNPWIVSIDISGSDFQSIDLPENNQLWRVHSTNAALTSDGLNDLVHAVYTSVVASGLHGGWLDLDRSIEGEPVDFVAPPSTQTLEELQTLRDVYAWNIKPGNF